ncbi:MAG: two-component system chemotaxis family sensor kinase CheA [Gammaproteobacteria bacterium]|nr:MAG: two-component system chemotaxis family sensor kinase CheA [Gammaproteobacteria bacterium]TND02450.1 MAG: two-component system, chemotaxis family, sensor kinase CheA [Gammaproteobacteria bacterium]
MTIDVTQFHEVFFEERLEHLANVETALLDLDSGGTDPEHINVIFRGAHSIKGGSGTFGFHEIAAFTHLLEKPLDGARSGRFVICTSIAEALPQSVDVFMVTHQRM